MTILMVDDDETLRDVLSSFIRNLGHKVHSAPSGNQAISILKSGICFDLIISDYYMPDGDGKQLLSYVQTAYPHKPIFVFLTGQTDMNPASLKNLGADEVLLKPFIVEDMLDMIARYRKKVENG